MVSIVTAQVLDVTNSKNHVYNKQDMKVYSKSKFYV